MKNITENIILISFYNQKALGLRYLENALTDAGYGVTVVYFKTFNSVNPKPASPTELGHLQSLISWTRPVAIGLSVMTSLYLETVELVSETIRENFKGIPIVWGGVYPTMFHEEIQKKYSDIVIRGEGEEAFVELAKNGFKPVATDQCGLVEDLDRYGVPAIGGGNKFTIEDDSIINADPQLKSYSYEISCSRGCPFACSYCCSINLKRIYAGKGKYVRFRSVDNVISELKAAKATVKGLKFIRFWDEIFCDDGDWVDKFTLRYKEEIGLPFEIWGHPLKCEESLISKLRSAGLYKVVMGIQSGSPYIRKEIFNRPETQVQIIKASQVLAKYKVPQVAYDFMLRHPFETVETLMETYELCMNLAPPFELQLHGLNFLPGTDIVKKALDMKLVDPGRMDRLMYASMQDQYDMYWQNDNNNPDMNRIYKMIYLTQFQIFRNKISQASPSKLDRMYRSGLYLAKLRYLYKRGVLVLGR